MKKLTFSCACALLCAIAFAQNTSTPTTPNIVKDHYTISGGILGAANFNKFRLSDNPAGIKYDTKVGWSAGAWVNFPLGKVLSIEPQVMYTNYPFSSDNAGSLLPDGHMDWISVPLVIKLHVGDKFAFTLGPQFDFLSTLKDNNEVLQKSEIESTNISAFGGIEVFPHGRVTIFARYIYGFTDLDKRATSSGANPKYYIDNAQLGLKFRLFGKHILADSDGDGVKDKDDKCPSQFGFARYNGCPIPDTDADGINDEEDKCPQQAGLPKYQGCPIPDTDKDGVNDEEDKCPQQAGSVKYQGCPIPDTDGDGINDEEDKCPQQAGLPKYQGCPIPDTDGDGINDEEDRCPNEPGVAEMKGCPKIANFQSYKVTFTSSSSTLTANGKKELDKVVDYLQKNGDLKVKLDGHTDNTGSDKVNEPLSAKRADAAKKYLVGKGVNADRITTEGHGSTMPVADNKTKNGKLQNRRVDVTVQ